MWVLRGVIEAHYPNEADHEKSLALFSTEQKGLQYIKESKLNTYQTVCRRGQCGQQFKKKSLLYGYCGGYIEPYPYDYLIVDPVL
jgi:hypothetical protein